MGNSIHEVRVPQEHLWLLYLDRIDPESPWLAFAGFPHFFAAFSSIA